MNKKYVIYGAGGHAKVVVDLIIEIGGEVCFVFDDQLSQSEFMGIPIKNYSPLICPEALLIIAIGNNAIRKKISSKIQHHFATLVHPAASISRSAIIDEGTVILANAIVQADALIGKHVIINAGACVDHDAKVEDFVHVSPLAYIGGEAKIGNGVLIGPSAIVMRNAKIEKMQSISSFTIVNS